MTENRMTWIESQRASRGKPLKSPKIGFGDFAWKVGRKKTPKKERCSPNLRFRMVKHVRTRKTESSYPQPLHNPHGLFLTLDWPTKTLVRGCLVRIANVRRLSRASWLRGMPTPRIVKLRLAAMQGLGVIAQNLSSLSLSLSLSLYLSLSFPFSRSFSIHLSFSICGNAPKAFVQTQAQALGMHNYHPALGFGTHIG